MTLRSRFGGSALHRTLCFTVKTLASLVILSVLLGTPSQPWNPGITTAFAATTVAESNDFATRVLRDPWDMSEFTDISTALNNSDQLDYLQNYQVANGIFSAQATTMPTGQGDGQFPLLFPGYRINQNTNSINVGKYGVNYPISSSTYHCLYVAMRVNSSSPDYHQVFWYADTHLNEGPSPWGYTTNFANSPSIWKLYQIDLANSANAGGQTAWSGSATWQGLVFKATRKPNATFAIDWVRLTDCGPVNTPVTWTPDQRGNSLWLTSGSTGNKILVQSGINGSDGSATLDTQGLAAGTYTVGLGTSTSCCYQTGSSITINQAPIAKFDRPSPYSGADYATQAGNPWDFGDAADIIRTHNVTWSLSNGLLNMTTASGTAPTYEGVADPIFYLNVPNVIASGSRYRYLTYRMYTQWPIQNVPEAMIVRWTWGFATGCQLVGHDIPFDVGWQTYSIDLSHPFNGSVVVTSACPPGTYTWNTSTNITHLRWDPNENILGQNLFQQLDWIRLTEVDKVTHGTPFPVQISLNKPPQGITFTYYYTTSPQQPTQHVASQYAASPPPPAGSHRLYLPLTLNSTNLAAGGLTFLWNTTSVSSGSYYICVTANDTKNQATYCSDAPVVVN